MLVGRTGARGVEIHALSVSFGKHAFGGGFYLLRAVASVAQFGVGAIGTLIGHTILCSTIMAHKFVDALMEREAHVAAGAARRPATSATLEHGRIAAAILEEDGLPTAGQSMAHQFGESGREGRLHHFAPLEVLHIGHLNLGHQHVAVAVEHLDQGILPLLRVVVGFAGGSGRAEQRFCPKHRSHHDGRVASMVARSRVLLLVARFVLFVDND